jgi:hypothetical protein
MPRSCADVNESAEITKGGPMVNSLYSKVSRGDCDCENSLKTFVPITFRNLASGLLPGAEDQQLWGTANLIA